MPVHDVRLNIAEIRKPELDAQLVAERHRAAAREARDVPPRDEARGDEHHAQRALSASRCACRAASTARKSPAPSGIARAAFRCTPSAPTSTTAVAEAQTTYGVIGVKVWIFKGEVFDKTEAEAQCRRDRGRAGRRRGRGSRSRAPSSPRPRRPRVRESRAMMQPKRTKYRKQFKGRNPRPARSAAAPWRSASSA